MATKRILLAEDDGNDLELTLAALEADRLGNQVVVARDGAEALDSLYGRKRFAGRPEGNPVLVLLDLGVPRVDGLEALRQVKGGPRLRTILVVVLTSSHEECDLVESYRLGVHAYVVKPVGFDKLVAAVRDLGLLWLVVNQPPPRSA